MIHSLTLPRIPGSAQNCGFCTLELLIAESAALADLGAGVPIMVVPGPGQPADGAAEHRRAGEVMVC